MIKPNVAVIGLYLLLIGFCSCSLASSYSIDRQGNILLSGEALSEQYGVISGKTGVDLIKEENGSWMQTIYVDLEYKVNKHLTLSTYFSENFTIMRGGLPIKPGNHHSWNYRIGIDYSPFGNSLFIYNQWDNASLIEGNDKIFEEEFGSNKNRFGIYYKF